MNAIEQTLPYDGPHTPDTVTAAGEALSDVVRYLNNATRNGEAALVHAGTVNEVLGDISAAASGLDQLLRQLGRELERQIHADSLYDDRRDRSGRETAMLTIEEISRARQHVIKLSAALYQVTELSSHLGNDLRT